MDDRTRLALAAADGDRVALAAFVRASQAEVWRLCRHLASADVADDLTQETFAKAIAALPRFRGDSSARTWLLSIARNTCADWVRSTERQRRRRVPVAHHEPDPAALVAVESLLAALPPEQRTAFVLTQVLGLSYAEAAATCDVPVGTIRSRVARSRGLLVDLVRTQEAIR